jgi:hypothetical protein
MTTASAAASTAPTTRKAARAAWLFPGRTELTLAVNWRQEALEAMLHDLRSARQLAYVKDLAQIGRLRLFSAQCSSALALCQAERDAA